MDQEQLRADYARATRRLLLFDYDGTLTAIAPTPADALPPSNLSATLRPLLQDELNDVVIISGREKSWLDRWFNSYDRLHLAAEHGYFMRTAGQPWQTNSSDELAWQPAVQACFDRAVQELPGSLIERKEAGLTWHYRLADPEYAAAAAGEVLSQLHELTKQFRFEVLQGRRAIEAKPIGCNKGHAAAHWLGNDDYDFVLAAGDDLSDEDMFAVLPPHAHSIKIGAQPSRATHRLPAPAALHEFLQSLAAA